MEEGKKIRLLKEIPIDYGIEVRTDLNGDGELERVTVRDNVSGVYAFTQVCVRLQDGNDIFKELIAQQRTSQSLCEDTAADIQCRKDNYNAAVDEFACAFKSAHYNEKCRAAEKYEKSSHKQHQIDISCTFAE